MGKYFESMIEDLLKESDSSSPQGKSELVERGLPIIFSNPDWFEQDRGLQKLTDATGIPRDQLRMIAKSWIGKHLETNRRLRELFNEIRKTSSVESVFSAASEDPLEKRAINLLLQHEELWEYRFDLKIDFFKDAEHREILSYIHEESTLIGVRQRVPIQRWMHLSPWQSPPSDKKMRDEEWAACLRRLQERYVRELKSLEKAPFQKGGDYSGSAEYIRDVESQALETNRRLRELFNDNRNL